MQFQSQFILHQPQSHCSDKTVRRDTKFSNRIISGENVIFAGLMIYILLKSYLAICQRKK